MRSLIVLLVVYFSFSPAFTQESKAPDSLLRQLSEETVDTSRSLILSEIAYYYALRGVDSVDFYALKSLDIAQQNNFQKGILFAYKSMGVAAVFSNELEQAKEFFLQVLTAAEKVPAPYEQVVALRILGNITFTLGEYPQALDFHSRCLDVSLEYNYTDIIPECYHNIGYVYYETGEYERAFEYLELCHQATNEYEVVDLYPNSLNNMAKVASYKKDYEQARIYARGILGMVDSIPNATNFIPVAYEHIGESFYDEKQYDSALFYYNEMLHSLEEMDEMYMGPKMIEEILAYRGIGKSQVALNRLEDAEASFMKAFTLSDESNNLEDKKDVARALSNVYEKSGNLAKSLEYHKIYKNTSDSLLSEEKVREITQVRMEYEFAERQKVQELVQAKKDANTRLKELLYIIAIGGVLFTLVFFIMLYRLQRNKTKREELQKENLQLNLDFKNQELTSNVLSMLKKNELLIVISDKLKKARMSSKASNKPLIDEMIREIEVSSKEIGWEEFEFRFKEIHADFYKRLNKRFPTLSPNEQRLCAFLRLNMSSKDISAITFQSYHSIVQARSRMRKKMGLEENESLTAFMNQL